MARGEIPSGVPQEWADRVAPLFRESNTVVIKGMELYQPREFKATTMLIGDPTSPVALCTTWADPWEVVDRKSIDRFSILAPLRTPGGIEVLLANLARHPSIHQVLIWAGGRFDNTPKASLPRDYLFRLFRDGIDDTGKIIGTDFTLNESLLVDGEINVIRKIISSVQIKGPISKIEDAAVAIDSILHQGGTYMEPHIFPELKTRVIETLPSEEVGLIVRQTNIFEAWLKLLDRIARYGRNCSLETGGAKVRELEFVRVIISNQGKEEFVLPNWASSLDRLGLTPEGMEKYYQEKILPSLYMHEIFPGVERFERPENIGYLYAQELFAYPRLPQFDEAVRRIAQLGGVGAALAFLRETSMYPRFDAENKAVEVMESGLDDLGKVGVLLELYSPPINQVEKIKERVKNMPDDADKMFVLWVPAIHGMRNRSRPCMVQGSLLVREETIDAKVVFRSHDVAKGWPENVYGVFRLVENVATETGKKVGSLVVDSESGHVYLNDLEWVEKLVKEQLWDKPPVKVFDSEELSDPRGNWLVNLVDEKIVLTLRDPTLAQSLLTLEDRTARGIMARLRQLDLIQQPDHALDIGFELAKAEACRLLGMEYVQDRPFDFRKARGLM